MRRGLVAAIGLGVTVLELCALGCSAPTEEAPVSLDQFPQTFAQAYCDSLEPCCNQASLNYTPAQCRSNLTDYFSRVAMEEATLPVRYDAAAAGRCLAVLKQTLATCKAPSLGLLSGCEAVFVGTTPAGGTCQSPIECASQACYNGVCSASSELPHLKVGSACIIVCTGGGKYPACAVTSTVGSPNGACYTDDGLFCLPAADDVTRTAPGKCVAFPKVGQACPDGECAAGSYCDAANGAFVCTAQRDSGSCENPNACSPHTYCASMAGGAAPQCMPPQPDGTSCNGPRQCASGVCLGPGTLGPGTCGEASLATADSCAGTAPQL